MDEKETALRKFRTRWRRWLGNKTRVNAPYWTTLLESTWSAWVDRVFASKGLDYEPAGWSRESVKDLWTRAIDLADIDLLHRLDNIYAEQRWMRARR